MIAKIFLNAENAKDLRKEREEKSLVCLCETLSVPLRLNNLVKSYKSYENPSSDKVNQHLKLNKNEKEREKF